MGDEKPLFTHDCARCVYLGTYQEQDLYFCEQSIPLPTVIARYGNHGWEYRSGMAAAEFDPVLAEAKRRAEEIGKR